MSIPGEFTYIAANVGLTAPSIFVFAPVSIAGVRSKLAYVITEASYRIVSVGGGAGAFSTVFRLIDGNGGVIRYSETGIIDTATIGEASGGTHGDVLMSPGFSVTANVSVAAVAAVGIQLTLKGYAI